jgi:hypothetical protein
VGLFHIDTGLSIYLFDCGLFHEGFHIKIESNGYELTYYVAHKTLRARHRSRETLYLAFGRPVINSGGQMFSLKVATYL